MKKVKYHNLLILEAGGPCGISCIKLLKKLDGVRLVAADMSSFASGLQMADVSIQIPPASSPKFSSTVEDIINKYKIDAIIPCFEYGYDKLKGIKGNFLIDFRSALICKDKLKFSKLCNKIYLPVPNTEPYNLNKPPNKYPVYIKPRFGVGSRNNYIIFNKIQFISLSELLPPHTDFIVQDYLLGEHWNIDILVDNGEFITAVPRRDILQKAGNPFTVEVKSYRNLITFSHKVQKLIGIKSSFNLEIFETKQGNITINEINPRFGNGIIFSALAGVDMVSYLVTHDNQFLGKIKNGIYTRYYEEIEVDTSKIARCF